jgi:steroid delta-isomerase-like uncharacterized protein
MDRERNKEAKKRYFDAFNAQDLEAIDELFAPDYVLHLAGAPDVQGSESLRQMVAQSFSNLSDAILRVEDMVAEGDKVVTRWTMTATHSGEFMGVPPTDRRLTMSGIIIDRFVDGRVVEAWESFDMYGLMAQLTEEGSRL